MTTLCRSDWIEAYGDKELRMADIDLLKLPTTSFEKMSANSPPNMSTDLRLPMRAGLQNNNQ